MTVMDALIPWRRVRVAGSSMTPTLLTGDWLLVLHGGRVRPGAIVLGHFRERPDLTVIKRAKAAQDGGWLLTSDNPRAGADSRQHGVADVVAVAIWQWPIGPGHHREPPWRRLTGRRPAGRPLDGG